MKLDPRFLNPHLHAAAVEQLSAELRGKGFTVARDVSSEAPSGQPITFDLSAERGAERVFYEVRILGDASGRERGRLRLLTDAARTRGAQLRLIVLRPDREVEVDVAGIEEALRAALDRNPTGELAVLGSHVSVDAVHGLDIERLQVRDDGVLDVAGNAVASMSRRAENGERLIDGIEIPFAFDLCIDRQGMVADAGKSRFSLDLSEWCGADE